MADGGAVQPELKPSAERRATLARTVANLAAGGWRVESHSDYRAVFAKTEWMVFERKQVAEVDEWGNVHLQRIDRQFAWF